jgi:nucleobase:cation symporter-1, NCS1 family
MDERTPNWGIEPVPKRLRVLGFVDLFLLWSSLSVSLLVIVAGAVLVDGDFGLGLSLRSALLAIVAAALVGNLLLGIAGAIGADARVPGMVLLRAPLGRRGSYLPTFLNVVQNLGWSIFELLIIATAAAALSDRVLGFHARWLWTLLFGGISVALALLGPVGFVRRYIRKFAIWVVLASLLYLTWWVLDRSNLHASWDGHGHGGSAWAGFDLVLASIISWTPLAADYTRFGRNRRSAFWGTGLGYFVPTIWMFGLGVLLLLSRHISDAAAIPAAVATGGVLSVVALLALTVDETDEAFADIYSTAVSIQNVFPQIPQRLLIALVAATATGGALLLDLRNYQTFLFLLGSFFVPLLGVLIADWLLSGLHYDRRAVFEGPAVRIDQILAWLAGFAVYQWLLPQGPQWWLDLIHHTKGPVDFSASLPSFATAFLLALLAGSIVSARAGDRRSREPLARPR